jgi:segregation and condensation protein B
VRVVGHRDVPGKPAMFGTTREFLDYFGLKKLDELPTLAEIKDGLPELSPQTDLIDSLEAQVRLVEQGVEPVPLDTLTEARLIELSHDSEAAVAEDSEVIVANRTFEAGGLDEPAVVEQDAQVIPLRARSESGE